MEDVIKKELIKAQEDIETYQVIMKVGLKKIRKKDAYEVYYYKSILQNSKIYDIRDRDDFIYIYYDITENIDDIINKKDKKEFVPINNCSPITITEIKDLFENKEGALCRINSYKIEKFNYKPIKGTGFFLEIEMKDIPFKKCLITNNHVLNGKHIEPNKDIILNYMNEKKDNKNKR